MPNPYVIIGLLAAWAMSLIGVGAWQRHDGEVAERNAWQTRENAALAESVKQRDAAINDRQKLAELLSANSDAATKQLRSAQNETNSLRDRISSGDVGLRIAAKCPGVLAATGSGTTTGAGVDSGAGTELAEPARRAYFALRDGIDQVSAQLAACQGELKIRTAR